MPYLTRKEKIKAYGSYNASNNIFLGKLNEIAPCYVSLWARCNRCNYYESIDACGNVTYHTEPKYSSFNYLNNINKVITKTVRISESEYALNKTAASSTKNIILNFDQETQTYSNKPIYKNKIIPTFQNYQIPIAQSSQSSDRAFPSRFLLKNNFINVPSHGNSTKTSLTRHRPGSAGPSGMGVDIKHNSYQRYLLKKKGLKNLRGEKCQPLLPNNFDKKVTNNKFKKDTVISNFLICNQKTQCS